MSRKDMLLASFGTVGPICAARGWVVYPQEAASERRPGTWRGRTIALRHGSLGDLALQAPSLNIVEEWALENPYHNVACLLGRGSGGVFALDFDVNTPSKAAALKELAFAVLGPTPFIRIGNAPRFALLYRSEQWEGQERLVSTGRRFDPLAGGEDGEAIEILGEGKTITLFGFHHKTGRLFHWEDMCPLDAPPAAAPLVTTRAVALFLEEAHRRFPFAVERSIEIAGWTWDETTRSRIPAIQLAGNNVPWRVDPVTGRIVDGREAFLTHMCFQIVRSNPELAQEAVAGNAEADARLRSLAKEAFVTTIARDGKWPDHRVSREVSDKIRRLLYKVGTGALSLWLPAKDERGARERVRLRPGEVPPELRFLKPRERRHPMGIRGVLLEKPDAARAAARAIRADRKEIGERLSAAIDSDIQRFLDLVYDWRDDGAAKGGPVRVLKAPTGAGKTSRLLSALLTDPRTVSPPPREDGQEWGPFLVLLPTFANIQELIERLVRESFGASSFHTHIVTDLGSDEFVPIELPSAYGKPISVFVYRGKIKAGCKMHEKVAALMKAGKSSSALCRTQIKEGEETKEIFCRYYQSCPAILQREQAARSHIVFMPHAFLTLSLPEQLRRPRAVIIDERVHHLLIRSARLAFDTLFLPRMPPRLTKKEKEAGIVAEDLIADRDMLVHTVEEAFQNGACPAAAIRDRYGEEKAPALVRHALRVCSSGLQKDDRIHPDISLAELLEICAEPKGFEIREEWRFWKIIEERLHALANGTAKGEKDVRLHMLRIPETNGLERHVIRLAWRVMPNWRDVPLLLLDASGSPEILRKVFPTDDLCVTDVMANPGPMMNIRTVACVDRTFSVSALVPHAGDDERHIRKAARDREEIRRLIEGVALAHGYGRVLVGGPLAVLRALKEDWDPPVNVDWVHFGAMRGLDAFKHHVAAVSIGRMEPPIWEVDAAAAALSFDEDVPEEPFDRDGTGRQPGEAHMPLYYPMAPRAIPLRDGSTVGVSIPEHPGRWGKLVQAQIREEEQRQFLGRLRPVYRRGTPPVWYCISSIIPEGVIVDDICSVRDVFEQRFLYLAEYVCNAKGFVPQKAERDDMKDLVLALLRTKDDVPAPLVIWNDPDNDVVGLASLPKDNVLRRILRVRAERRGVFMSGYNFRAYGLTGGEELVR